MDSAIGSLPLASFGTEFVPILYFLGAEGLAVFSTWALVALERYNRARVLELAAAKGLRDWAMAHLDRAGTYDLTVRLTRFFAVSLLVVGIAWAVFRVPASATGGLKRIPWGPLGAAVALTFAVNFLVNDIAVRFFAKRHPNRFLLAAFPFLDVLRVVSAPIRVPTSWLAWVIFRIRLDQQGPGAREEVRAAVGEAEREGAFSAPEADMVEAVIDLRDRTAGDIFTSRGEVEMLRGDVTIADAVRTAQATRHSRFPVYGRDRDDVLGYVGVRDLLAHWGRPTAGGLRVRDVMRPPFFVPQTKPLLELLEEMRQRRVHLAMVTDEFGGTAGIVTIEDVLEAIVGPIDDEFDTDDLASAAAKQAEEGRLVVDGRTSIEEVNRVLKVALPIEEHFETVGGLVLHRLGKVPRAGESLTLDGVALTVTEADERTVKQLQVVLLPHGR